MTVGSPFTTTDCPYRGIHPFRYVDRQNFFGREGLVHELFAKVLLYRLVVLFGESGAGKSSLVNAGLIPVLQQEGLNAERVRVRPIPDQPMLIKRIRANREDGGYLPTIFGGDDLASRGSKKTVPCSLEGFLTAVAEKSNQARPLLVFDQFEELFTLFEPREGQVTGAQPLQKEILDTILQIAKDEKLRAKIVVSIREDYLGKLEVLVRDYPQILDYRVRLRYLSVEDAQQAIRGPFEAKSPSAEIVTDKKGSFIAQLTKQLADRIVRDLSGSSGDLVSPTHVQIVCTRLWEKYASDMPEIGETQYQAEGGVKGILEGFFRTELDKIEPRDLRPVAVAILASLITASGTRDVVSEEKLRKLLEARDVTPASFRSVLESLEDRRLVNSTPQRGTYFYEVASEYLIPPIEKEARELATEQERVEAARARAEAQEQARQAARFRWLAWALGAILLLALAAGVFAVWQWRNARRSEKQATDSDWTAKVRELVANSREAEQTDPELSVLIATHGVSAAWLSSRNLLPDAENQLRRAIFASHVRLTLSGHTDRIRSVAWSPDGQRLATASADRTAKVWDASTGELLFTLSGHGAPVTSVAWSPDGKRMATGSEDKTAKVWDVTTGKELLILHGHSRPVTSVAWSPDGKRLATGSEDKTAKVWDDATGKELLTLSGHGYFVYSVAWSPDGHELATGSGDWTARVWDVESGKPLVTLRGHGSGVLSVAWSPDGKQLVTGSGDGTTRVWDIPSGRGVRVLEGHLDRVEGAVWSCDSRLLATASGDRTAGIWDSVTGKELLALHGHTGAVYSVAWSPDCEHLATGSEDDTAKVWDAANGEELLALNGHRGPVTSVAWSSNGKRLATGSEDRTAKVWDAATGKQLLTLSGHHGFVTSVAWSAPQPRENERLATGSTDNTAKEWEATGKELLTLSGHSYSVRSVAWSPDGKRLSTGSSDDTAKVWDAVSGHPLLTLPGHKYSVSSVAWSPDGKRLATGSWDWTAKVWDADNGGELLTLGGHKGDVYSVAWSRDGKRIATGSRDQTAKVWDAGTGKELLTLSGHSGPVLSVAWSPDGRWLATGSSDRTIIVFDTQGAEKPLTLGGDRGRVLSVAWSPDGQRLAIATDDWTVRVRSPLCNMDARQLMALARQRVTKHPSEEGCKKYLRVDKCPPVPQLSFW